MRSAFLLFFLISFTGFAAKGQPPCTGTPQTGVIYFSSDSTIPMNMLFAAGFDSLSGMTYHWEHSSVGCSGPWSNIDSSAMLFFNDWYLVLPFGQTNLYGWYRITATCLNSGLSSTSNCFYYDATTTTSYCPAWYSYIASGNGLNIHFTPYSASPGTYAWDFGDGNTSSDPSPSHQYAANGVYNVCLTYTDIDGNACSYCNTVNAVATAMLNGLVYNDENQNGQHDSGEPGIPNQTVSANGFGTAYTDSSGHYTVQVPLGTYDLQFNPFNTNPTAWSLTTPSSGTYSVDANDTVTFDGFDFGVYVDPNYHDVSVEMSCENPVSGFWNYNNYIVKNTGFTAEDVTLVVTYDSVLAYTQGFPSPSAVDAISRTLTYNLQALPGDTYFFVEYQCAIGTPLLTAVYNHVAVTLNGATDINLSNNTATCQTAVVGSYDPNDKQVNPAGLGVNNAVHPNDVDELTYRVRFQNTGTAPAYFITVLDTLDDSVLDVTSFQFLEHSHPCQVQITEGNILRVHFPNIMLPDSFTNEPGSHGHFFFKIKRHQGLTNGTVISNKAYIYFDYNEPVITNTSFVTLDENLSSGVVGIKSKIEIYPVPADKGLTLFIHSDQTRTYTFDVYDLVGRQLYSGRTNAAGFAAIDVSGMKNGMYFIRVNDRESVVAVNKFTVNHAPSH